MPRNQQGSGSVKIYIDAFTSTKTVLGLFALLVFFLIPVTLFTGLTSTLLVPVKIILAVLGLNLLLCTITRFKRLRPSTLVIHFGTIVILIGGYVSTFGYVATVNVYEGTSINTVYRWDVQEDAALGVDLRVAQINLDFYPVPLKIGVLKNGQKGDVFLTRTGETFMVDAYKIQAVSFDPFRRDVRLAVTAPGNKQLGTLTTSGRGTMPGDFPLEFKLVAFQDPVAKRMWVDLELSEGDKVQVTGTSEVNHPLKWKGLQFFLTQVSADEQGRPYAGIQISRDPGRPVVYSGIIIFCLGLLLALARWAGSRKRPTV